MGQIKETLGVMSYREIKDMAWDRAGWRKMHELVAPTRGNS